MQNEELRAARLEMETALARYTELFDFAPVGYATFDSEQHILNVNHAGAELLGSPRALLRRRSFSSLLDPEHRIVFHNLIVAARGSCTRQSAVLDVYAERQRRVPVRLSVCALPQVKSHVLIAFEDISQLEQSQRQLELKERELREADRRKDEFLAALSHELRNPLAPIRNSLFVLERSEPGSESARRSHRVIERQVTHLARLVDDLLDATRIARGKIQLRLQYVELSGLLQGALDDHRPSFDAAQVALEAQLESPTWVRADPARLLQIRSNVLANALKFTPSGGRVRVGSSIRAGRVDVCISNTGVGTR